ncbi:collagen-like triple helix repeat-containing protein [Corynebacterium kalidii]
MAEFCTVKRAVAAYVVDGPDDDTDPDRLPVQGQLTLTPVLGGGDAVTMVENGHHVTVVPRPIDARISDGVILHRGREGVRLLAGGEQMNPPRLVWKATFANMQAGGWSFKLSPIVFEVVPGGEVDLTLVAPVANVPEGITRGPAGTSLHDIVPEGGELVVTVSDDAGVRELRRIPLEDVVRAEADAAARVAADSAAESVSEELRREVADDTARAISARDGAETAQKGAETARDDARGEVTRQISAVVDGAPEDLNTLRELAEYATENRDILDQVNAAIANKAARDHTHDIDAVDGLRDALDTKVNATSTASSLYGTDADGDQTMLSYSPAPTASTLAHRGDGGTLQVGSPTDDTHATTRGWVEGRAGAVERRVDEVAETVPVIAVVDEHPADADPGTIYLVREPE